MRMGARMRMGAIQGSIGNLEWPPSARVHPQGVASGYSLCVPLFRTAIYFLSQGNGVTTSTGLVETFSPRMPSKIEP